MPQLTGCPFGWVGIAVGCTVSWGRNQGPWLGCMRHDALSSYHPQKGCCMQKQCTWGGRPQCPCQHPHVHTHTDASHTCIATCMPHVSMWSAVARPLFVCCCWHHPWLGLSTSFTDHLSSVAICTTLFDHMPDRCGQDQKGSCGHTAIHYIRSTLHICT